MSGRCTGGAAAVVVLSALAPAQAGPQDTVRSLDTVTVIGTRASRALEDAARSVTVIGPDQIAALRGLSLAGIVETSPAVDIRERGPGGAQADLAMRGGSFEQALVMVDGVPVTDPQTGHHLLDIPLTADQVERVEVLSGQASRLYGPSAVGGVVNIVTRAPCSTGVRLGAAAGERGVLEGWADAALATGALGLRMGASHAVSDGYRYNSDTDLRTVSCRATARLGSVRISGLAAHIDKDFGANGFYSDRYPDQREHTATVLATLGATASIGNLTLTPRVSWRRHDDDYVLDWHDPAFYRNVTRADVLSGGAQGSLAWRLGTLSVAVDGNWERIDSDDLGTRERYRGGVHVEQVFVLWHRLTITPGVVMYYATPHGWKVWPGGEIGLDLTHWMRLWGGVDYSFRVPSFTELYTSSPANAGDPDLAAERALSCEAGVRFSPGPVRGSLSVYRREGRDVIDWVRAAGRGQWVAGNVDEVNATGGETSWQVQLPGRHAPQGIRLETGYAFVDVQRELGGLRQRYAEILPPADTLDPATPLAYKYGDDYLRHKVTIGVDHALPLKIRANWRLRYEVRNGSENGAVLLDARVYLNMARLALFVDVGNLLDVSYRDLASIPGAPRWFRAGISLAALGADMGGKRR